jgi:hypothetical protein
MKGLDVQDTDILEVCDWRSIVVLRRYTGAVAQELAALAHERCSPADRLRL